MGFEVIDRSAGNLQGYSSRLSLNATDTQFEREGSCAWDALTWQATPCSQHRFITVHQNNGSLMAETSVTVPGKPRAALPSEGTPRYCCPS